MRMVTCPNGHQFDADKHTFCPYCSANIDSFNVNGNPQGGGSHTQPINGGMQPMGNQGGMQPMGNQGGAQGGGMHTQPISGGMQSNGNQGGGALGGMHTQPLGATSDNGRMTPRRNIDGKTSALDSVVKKQQETGKTVAMYHVGGDEETTGVEPCCGWLVCINGKPVGKSYEIYMGGNTIGRDTTNKISIPDDSTISRQVNCEITYDPRGKRYYLSPGAGKGLTYLNDQIVLSPQEIKSYDKVLIGETEFLFIALCGEMFSWR